LGERSIPILVALVDFLRGDLLGGRGEVVPGLDALDLNCPFVIFHTISIKRFGGKDHHNLSPHTTSNVN
jgi:hypothetical protein